MGEFVRKKLLTVGGAGSVLTTSEDHVGSHRVGPRIRGVSRPSRRFVVMDADAADVVAEARVQEGSRLRIEGLARLAHDIGHRRRWCSLEGRAGAGLLTLNLLLFVFLLTRRALPLHARAG